MEYALPDETGFRGFIVEFYNVISDVVVQDGYQSVLNLRTVLHQISARHPRITRCSRESDGAGSYASIFVALFQLQLGRGGKSGTIKVIRHGHNEPGHGSDICDTAGANCIRECWRATKRTGLSVISAYRTTKCLREAEMAGFIHRQVSHDPDRKIVLPKGTSFDGVLIKSCLHKEYPQQGVYAGGIVFHRYLHQPQPVALALQPLTVNITTFTGTTVWVKGSASHVNSARRCGVKCLLTITS